MVPQTLVIKTRRYQLVSMFHLRGLFSSAKNFCFVLVLLSAIFVLVTCKRCSVNEVQNLDLEACRSFRGNFDSTPDAFDDDISLELVSKHSIEQPSLENACPSSSSFCFPSTLTEFLENEDDMLEPSDGSGTQSEPYSSGLEQKRSNLSWSLQHGIFKLLDGRRISCSLYQLDVFPEFPSCEGENKNGQQTDVSSCISPPFDKMSKISKSGENAEIVNSGLSDGLSTPPMEIKPSTLDWGHKNLYYPSLAFLTVKNVDDNNYLIAYDLYSSNSQFYPCNFSEVLLAPGEIASICLVFFPTQLGLSSAQLVLQTSFGGFLIQAKGFAVDSPYVINHLSGLDISSSGRWRKNFSLFNPFDEALYVKEVIAWISTSSGNSSRSSKSICSIHNMEDSGDYSILSPKGWLDIERSELGQSQIALRPYKSWEVGPQKTETIMELDISDHFEGKITAVFCLHLLNPIKNITETVMVPLEAELSPSSTQDTSQVSVSLEALVPCNRSGSIVIALSVRNNSPYLLNVVKVSKVGDIPETFQSKSAEGLILFPGTITQVAIFNYAHMESPEVNKNCKILVQINDTRNSQIEIPCIDVISVCYGRQLDSSVGYSKGINNVDYRNGGQISFSRSIDEPPSEIKAVDTREADEIVLKSWKSQATASFMSVLNERELLFPTVLIGNHSSQMISINNPSHKPVIMQLILNSGESIDNCNTPEMILQPSSTSIVMGNKSNGPTRYGFSIAKDGVTEAFVHPYGSATFGPIIFQPSNRCEWKSSVLIRNNLSGVEWLSLRGFGGSFSLVLHEGYDPVHNLEFKLNMQNQLNLSSQNTPSCSKPLTKDVYAKNNGDFPLEVKRIKVSGAECGLDGFIIHNCNSFSIQPGESARLHISHQADFSVATMQRDLEVVLASGILVIPMKVSLPIYMLSFCKRSMFWMRVKKAAFVIVFAASLLYLLVFLLLPFASQDLIKSGKNSFSFVTRALDSLHMHFNWKNGFRKSVDGQGHKKPSSVENFDMQDTSDSRNLRVKVGKEKGRRRRKKKNSGAGMLLFEVSSSQSGNSTPSSPLSPVTSPTPKRPWTVSTGMGQQSVEAKNPFSKAPIKQIDKSKCIEPSNKINLLNNKVPSEKPYIARKVAGRAVLLPSATFPSAARVVPPWTCHSPFLASTSTIAPHARAPGTKLHNQNNGGIVEKMGFDEKYTYDIWGAHLFGLPLTNSKEVTSVLSSPIENNSESFFVRGPQTLVSNSVLPPVRSDLEGNE